MQPAQGDTAPVGALKAFLIYANLPVGGIAVCFVLGTYALLRLSPSVPLVLLAFCAVFLVYQVERAVRPAPEDAFNQPARLAWVARHRHYVRVSTVLALGGALMALPWLRPETLAAGAVLALGSGLYMTPLGPRQRRLKSVWYLKPLVISGAWAVGGVLLPVLEAGVPVTLGVAALIGYRFLFVLPNTLLADWPDRHGDAQAGLGTVATRLTAAQIRLLSLAALLVAGGSGLVAMAAFEAPWVLAVDLVGLLVMAFVVGQPWPASRLFFGLVLDLIVAWPVVTAAAVWLVGL